MNFKVNTTHSCYVKTIHFIWAYIQMYWCRLGSGSAGIELESEDNFEQLILIIVQFKAHITQIINI